MQIKSESWVKRGQPDWTVVAVTFDADEVAAAGAIADRKLPHVNQHDPAGRARSPEVQRRRIVAGKLADRAVLACIQNVIEDRNLPHVAYEYDAVRHDDFRRPDPYDLAVARYDPTPALTTVEVRSSFIYQIPEPRLMLDSDKISVLGYYVSQNKPAERLQDAYWQVCFHMRPADVERREQWPDVPVFTGDAADGPVTAYVVGGALWIDLRDRGANAFDRSENATYRLMAPIRSAVPVAKLLDRMLR